MEEKEEKIYVDDFVMSNKKLIVNTFDTREASPYGIGFERPLFFSEMYIDAYRIYNTKNGTFFSAKVKLSKISDFRVSLFYTVKKNEKDSFIEQLKYSKKLQTVYSVNIDRYMNKNKLQLNAEKVWLVQEE